MNRRDFLKSAIIALTPLIVEPVRLFIPPREPYVRFGHALDGVYSHLGVLPASKELNICEGALLEIEAWDGVGYPCLVQNVCTFGPNPPRAWIYDFDLWNFRHDDQIIHSPERLEYPNHAAWHATRRFGDDAKRIVLAGGGFLSRRMYGSPV